MVVRTNDVPCTIRFLLCEHIYRKGQEWVIFFFQDIPTKNNLCYSNCTFSRDRNTRLVYDKATCSTPVYRSCIVIARVLTFAYLNDKIFHYVKPTGWPSFIYFLKKKLLVRGRVFGLFCTILVSLWQIRIKWHLT